MKPWSPRAVLFDFDGTLADSYPAIAASVNHVRALRGHNPLLVEEVKRFVGRGPVHLLTHLIPEVDVERDLAAYRAHHPTVMKPLTRLLPGVAETLDLLHAQGIAMATCSNKPRIFTSELLAYLGVLDHFATVLGPEDVARLKPAPDMLLAALKRLAVAPADALYVGDMAVDVEAARAAGMPVWIVCTGSDSREAIGTVRPDRVLESMTAFSFP